jgi:hypothetical protein
LAQLLSRLSIALDRAYKVLKANTLAAILDRMIAVAGPPKRLIPQADRALHGLKLSLGLRSV